MAAVQAALPESGLSSPCNLQQVKQHSTRYTGSFAGAISEIVTSEIVISEIVGVVAPTRQPTGSWQHAQTSVSAAGSTRRRLSAPAEAPCLRLRAQERVRPPLAELAGIELYAAAVV